MKKEIAVEEVGNLQHYLTGPIGKAISYLQDMQIRYPDSILVWECRRWNEGLHLDNLLMETDSEYVSRRDRERIVDELALHAKRVQLERLKKELGEK